MNTLLHRSQQLYRMLLQLYPVAYQREFAEEMQYVFSRMLKDQYKEQGVRGVAYVWLNTVRDTVTSLIREHHTTQRNIRMKKQTNSLIMQNKVFGWLLAGTGAVLLIPFLAMQLGTGVDWDLFDFTIIGVLLLGSSSLAVLIARTIDTKYWKYLWVATILGIMWIWAELAVGVFLRWGS